MTPSSLLDALRRGAGWKLGADLLGRLLQYVLLWLAARQLAQGDFGDFSFALSVGYMLAQIADFGLQLFVQRELARLAILGAAARPFFRDEAAAARLVGGGLIVKAALTVPALLIMGGLVLVEPLGNKPALLLLGLAMVLATNLEYFAYCFRALQRLQDEAAAIILARGANLLLGAGLLLSGAGVLGLAIAGVAAMTAGIVYAYLRLLRYLTPAWRLDLGYWRRNARQPAAVGLGIVFSMLSFRADNLLLPPLVGREELGVYNAAYKLFEPSLVLPAVLLAVAFPLLARAGDRQAAQGHAGLRRLLGQVLLISLALGAAAAAALALAAAPLVSLLYGPSYNGAIPVLQILALACLPMYLNYGLTHALIATDRGHTYAIFMLLALCCNVAANLLLVSRVGIAGAALATVATELLLLLLCAGAMRRGADAGTALTAGTLQETQLERSL